MNFKKINNITGWVVCLIACTVYILTAEAGGSLWDCGEFVSSAFKVQIPHPPGAPLFVLMGRVFIVLFGDNPATAAHAVNIMSALASGFTILFLFWTITHFARKIMGIKAADLNSNQILTIMGAGAVGALAYTFSDSFWYSAVEGEVYACSSFFTALVIWATVKWEQAATADDELRAAGQATNHPDRWLVFIFFTMGLAIGVHLLNLLCIPAIVMVYYYKRCKVSNWNTFWAFMIGCAITGFAQKGVIQYTIVGAGYFDIFGVNSLHLPFFTGFGFYFLLIAAMIFIGLRFKALAFKRNLFIGWFALLALIIALPMMIQSSSVIAQFFIFVLAAGAGAAAGYFMKVNSLRLLKLCLWCFGFMLIGYSSYLTTMIRSNADPAVDMYNVDNPQSLVGYLGREQYGDFPLIYGQKFTAQPNAYTETYTKYQKSKDRYIENGKEGHYEYDPAEMMLFPRVWDASNDQGHADYYAAFLNIGKTNDGFERDPDFFDNVKFFVGYQNYFMYLRYFGWNFLGKQNDVQGTGLGNPRDGNWITGISFIDNLLYGDQSKLPDTLKANKSHNTLFALPFILGMIGLFYHYKKNKKDFLVNMLLFFFTGFAIVLYLNQAGNQPRERDYAYVGSFYAFAVWIGLGVMQVSDWLKKIISPSVATSSAVLVSLLAVPAIMASQEWDDHDRSKKTIARDLARNYLESCDKNAILFTFGDNDTYPLWYAQEVEHIRPDIRVINYSLMGIDWYINQLRYKVNQSDGMEVIFTPEQVEGRKRDYIKLNANGDQTTYRDLDSTLRYWVGSDDPSKMDPRQTELNTFPTKRFSVPVDVNLVKSNGTVNAKDTGILSSLKFELQKAALQKNDLAVLAIIAANKWKRPIYFTNPTVEGLGFDNYLRRDGMSFRLVPIAGNESVNDGWMYDKVMNKFSGGNADVHGVYFDEENRRHLNNIRQGFASLSLSLSAKNQKDSAKKVLEKVDKMIPEENMPYGLVSRYNMQNRMSLMLVEAAYRAGDSSLVTKIGGAVQKDLDQQMNYYASLGGMSRAEFNKIMDQYASMKYGGRQKNGEAEDFLQNQLQGRQQGMTYEISQAFVLLKTKEQMESQYKPKPDAAPQLEKPQQIGVRKDSLPH